MADAPSTFESAGRYAFVPAGDRRILQVIQNSGARIREQFRFTLLPDFEPQTT
jgi:hypothetical protein